MPHQGAPTWNGEIGEVDLKECFFPYAAAAAAVGAVVVFIENCEDQFIPITTN